MGFVHVQLEMHKCRLSVSLAKSLTESSYGLRWAHCPYVQAYLQMSPATLQLGQSAPASRIEAASSVQNITSGHWQFCWALAVLQAACLVVTEDTLDVDGTESCRHLLCRKLVLQQCSEQACVRLVLPQLEHLEVTLCNDLHALCLECPQLVTCSISECSSLWQVGSPLHPSNPADAVGFWKGAGQSALHALCRHGLVCQQE